MAEITSFDVQRPSMLRSWVVVLAATLFFFYIFIQMNLFNSINTELVKEFHLNASQLGQLFAFYFYGNVLFLFPAGLLLDRLSVRNLLLTVFTISVIATYVFSTSSSLLFMNMARLATGVAGAFALLSAIKIATKWFEPKHMALVVGVIVSFAMVGGIIAQTPLTILTQKFGWRHAMQFVAVFGAILIVIQVMLVKDNAGHIEASGNMQEHVPGIGFWQSLKMVLTNSQNWLSGIYVSLVNLPMFVFGGIWGVSYLTEAHHLTQIQATETTSMIFIGMMIGSPLAGLISDGLKLRKLPMIFGALLSIAAMLVIMFAPDMPLWAEIGLYLMFGIIISAQVIGYPVIAESNPPSITATATGLGSTLIMTGGVLVPMFGWLLELAGDSKVVDGATIYTSGDFIHANYMLLGGLIIALIAALLVKETRCKPLNQ